MNYHRLALRSSFFVVLMLLALSPAIRELASQPVPAPTVPTTEKKDEAPTGYQSFNFPEDRESRQRVQAIIDYMERKSIPWDVVCTTAQNLLDAQSDAFFSMRGRDAQQKSFISVKSKVNSILDSLPKEGQQFYELTYGPTASALLTEATADRIDPGKLADVSQRYFHTNAGTQATLLLAALQLDLGEYVQASYSYQRLLDRNDGERFNDPQILIRAIVAYQRSGDLRLGEQVPALWEKLEKNFPRDGLQMGRQLYAFDTLKTELDKPFQLDFSTAREEDVAMRYGSPTHAAVYQGGVPFLDPILETPLVFKKVELYVEPSEWIQAQIKSTYEAIDRKSDQVPLPGFFPVTLNGMVIYRTYDGVYARATRNNLVLGKGTAYERSYNAGELIWDSPAPKGSIQTRMSDSLSPLPKMWWAQYWQQQMPTVLFENAQAGSLSHDGRQVYYVDDYTLPPPMSMVNVNQFPGGFGGMPGQPNLDSPATGYNVLNALDAESGSLKWSLGGLAGGSDANQDLAKLTSTAELFVDAIVLGPPLPLNGQLFVMFEREGKILLACLDPYRIVTEKRLNPATDEMESVSSPNLIWVQELGSPATQVQQDSLRRIQPSYLAASQGILVCPTNAGAIIAIDINARRLLWANYYGSKLDPNQLNRNIQQLGGRRRLQPQVQTVPNDRWRASAPIITRDKVIFTAYDSDNLVCLNLQTGEEVWSIDRDKDDLYVGGIYNDSVVIVAKDSLRAYRINTLEDDQPKLAWTKQEIPTPTGHGVVSRDGLFYIPVVENVATKQAEPQIWAIDLTDGKVRSKTLYRRHNRPVQRDARLALGNLIFHDGQMFSQTATELVAFPLLERKLNEMNRLLAKDQNDPAGLTYRGELYLDQGKIKEAIADFQRAQGNNPTPETQRTLREKLYYAYTSLLRADFAAGEKYLPEYKTLCIVDTSASNPSERLLQTEEQLRRTSLYLQLLAQGREQQGRIHEAFEAYGEFARLRSRDELIASEGSPNTLARPDVWARGRILSMINDVDDPQRLKPLREQLARQWNVIRQADDLTRLRDFAEVYGPLFEIGRQAQFELVDRLMTKRDEESYREAQSVLMQLWARAESKPESARSLEALARLMILRHQYTSAVQLYTRLADDYPTIKVRGDQTGSDLYVNLITDKRLLPFIEPTRDRRFDSYNIVTNSEANVGGMFQSFTIYPRMSQTPLENPYEFTLRYDTQRNAWTLLGTERSTGQPAFEFSGLSTNQLQPFQQTPLGPPTHTLSQSTGNLLLLTLGQYAYCFDLLENKQLWQRNLLGEEKTNQSIRFTFQQKAPGETVIDYPDGWSIRLGQGSVLQPTYVSLMTRDGLVVLDPRSGKELWTREGVPTNVQMFGDATHIYLVEEGKTSRVLRALDGHEVENVPQFANRLNNGNLGIYNSKLLQVFTVEFDSMETPINIHLYDPLHGKDVWTHQLPKGAVVCQTYNEDYCGYIEPNGKLTVLNVEDGKPLVECVMDKAYREKHLHLNDGRIGVREPSLLMDENQVYLVLPPPGENRSISTRVSFIKVVPVDGTVYAFNRKSGQRLWFNEDLFTDQLLVVEKFDQLPVLMAMTQGVNQQKRRTVFKVVMIDKLTGKLRYQVDRDNRNSVFLSMLSDSNSKGILFWGYNFKLTIEPIEKTALKR